MYIFMPNFKEILNTSSWPIFLYFLPSRIFSSVFFKTFHISRCCSELLCCSVLQTAAVFISNGDCISVAICIPNLTHRWTVSLNSFLVPFSRTKDSAKGLSRILLCIFFPLFSPKWNTSPYKLTFFTKYFNWYLINSTWMVAKTSPLPVES